MVTHPWWRFGFFALWCTVMIWWVVDARNVWLRALAVVLALMAAWLAALFARIAIRQSRKA